MASKPKGIPLAYATTVSSGRFKKEGALSSTTMMVWSSIDALPHASIAVHCRSTVDSLRHSPGITSSSNVSEARKLHPSSTSGDSVGRSSSHDTVNVAGPWNTGAIVSIKVTTRCTAVALPQASVTVMVKSFTTLPLHDPALVLTEVVMVVVEHASSTVNSGAGRGKSQERTTESTANPLANNTEGASSSMTSMTCSATRSLPHPSTAWNERTIVYSLGQEPGMVVDPSVNVTLLQASMATATSSNNASSAESSEQLTVALSGMCANMGPMLSTNDTVWVAVLVLPQASVAVAVQTTSRPQSNCTVSNDVTNEMGPSDPHPLVKEMSASSKLCPSRQLTVKSAGIPMTGPKVSTTNIVWVAVVVVPHKLVNEKDRVMISSTHSGKL